MPTYALSILIAISILIGAAPASAETASASGTVIGEATVHGFLPDGTATTTTAKVVQRAQTIESKLANLQGKIAERKDELEAKVKAAVGEIQAKRKEIKIALKADIKARISARIEAFESNSKKLFSLLETQDKKLEDYIAKLKAKGGDTLEAEARLKLAKGLAADAKASVEASAAGAKANLALDTSSRSVIVNPIETAFEMRKKAREAYQAVVEALKEAKATNQ